MTQEPREDFEVETCQVVTVLIPPKHPKGHSEWVTYERFIHLQGCHGASQAQADKAWDDLMKGDRFEIAVNYVETPKKKSCKDALEVASPRQGDGDGPQDGTFDDIFSTEQLSQFPQPAMAQFDPIISIDSEDEHQPPNLSKAEEQLNKEQSSLGSQCFGAEFGTPPKVDRIGSGSASSSLSSASSSMSDLRRSGAETLPGTKIKRMKFEGLFAI